MAAKSSKRLLDLDDIEDDMNAAHFVAASRAAIRQGDEAMQKKKKRLADDFYATARHLARAARKAAKGISHGS